MVWPYGWKSDCEFLIAYLPATLQSEGHFDIAYGITLTIYGANTDTPRLRTIAGQLGYVIGYLAIGITFALPVDFLDILDETHKIRYNKLLAESLGNQNDILSHHTENTETMNY